MRLWSWGVLLLLLGLLLLGAATFDRGGWPAIVGDEATYLMQAQSLAFDGDLLYDSGDYRRFLERWNRTPEGVILQSGDGGETVAYGKPFFYALFLAPFVRASAVTGVFVANALLLCVAAVIAARRLRLQLGDAAPLWIAAFVFCSVTFAHAFWAHADLFLMSLAAIALAITVSGDAEADAEQVVESERRRLIRLAIAGALLAIVVFSRPLYLPILLPPALVAWRRHWRGIATLAGGVLSVVVVAALVHQSLAGSWTGYGGERAGFYSHTGFPGVDYPASRWNEELAASGNRAARSLPTVLGSGRLTASVTLWNGVYFLVGRSVGVLPYFLPVLLVFTGKTSGIVRWSLPLAVLVSVAAFLALRPYNFYGGAGALANRYFLPLYPAFWFVAERPLLRRWTPFAAAVLAAPFLAPLWLAPRDFAGQAEGRDRHVGAVARDLLPPETTQRYAKDLAQPDVTHCGLWIRFLDDGATQRGADLLLRRRTAELIVASSRPLAGFRLTLSGGEPDGFVLRVGDEAVRATGEVRDQLSLREPESLARHTMWWGDPASLYHVRLRHRGDRPLTFSFCPTTSGRSRL